MQRVRPAAAATSRAVVGVAVALTGIGVARAAESGVAPVPASAASAPLAGDVTPAAGDAVTTVVITANKRSQSRQQVAGTITSIGGATLEAEGIQDVEGVLRRTPGVQTNKGDPDQSMPTIRGIGTVTNVSALGVQQSTTGIYIEDVPFTDPIGVTSTPDLAPFDLDGIDILRGPQGALYGSSSLGGAIRYTLAKPGLKNFAFSALADVAGVAGSGLDHSEYAMANVPLVKDVAGLRTVVFDRQDTGYIDNLGTGKKDSNNLQQRGGRVIGVFKPTTGLKITGTYLTQQTRISDAFSTSPDPHRLDVSTPTPTARDDRFTLANVQVEADLNRYTLTSSTAVVSKWNDTVADETALFGDIGTLADLPVLPVVFGPSRTRTRAVSEELRLSSPADARFNYVAGVFFQHYSDDFEARLAAPGGAALLGADNVPGGLLYTEDDVDSATEKAVFADADYRLTDALSVGVGGRYYRNDQRSRSDSHLLDALFGASPPESVANAESGFTPKFNVTYRTSRETTWYVSASKGYRFGGTNFGSHTRYKSDSLWSYEAGLHLTQGSSLKVDVAGFWVKWNDAQVNARVGTGELAFNGINNVGKATIKGLELNAAWTPVAAFSIDFSGACIDARTATDFTSSNDNDVPSGTRLPGTARVQTALGATYRFEAFGESSGSFSLSHSYMGPRTTNIDLPGRLPGYGQLDSRLTFAWTRWTWAAYVNNVANSRGLSGGSTLQSLAGNSYSSYYPIKPRTIGMSLRFDY